MFIVEAGEKRRDSDAFPFQAPPPMYHRHHRWTASRRILASPSLDSIIEPRIFAVGAVTIPLGSNPIVIKNNFTLRSREKA
jgi:hypothetical protein